MNNSDDFWMGYMMGSCDNDDQSSGGGDPSVILAVLCVVGGLVLEALFLTAFQIEASDVPGILLLIGWGIGMSLLAFLVMLYREFR